MANELLPDDFVDTIIPDEQTLKKESEKEFLKNVGKENKEFLVSGLSEDDRKNIAKHIATLLSENKSKHKELEEKLDEWDEVYRMVRKPVLGDDGDMPNYRFPMSTVSHEVIHANIMNVFFTPADIMKVIPTEQGDVPKIKKLDTFGNWSMKNEMDIFEMFDRLDHASIKDGEAPYIIHWVKEYGVDIIREEIKDPMNPTQPLLDEQGEIMYREKEEMKILYNGPKMEVFSRKDYFQPDNAMMGHQPPWEMRRIRMTYDTFLRDTLKKKMYPSSIEEIKGWGRGETDTNKFDLDGDTIPIGDWEKEFIEFYGRLRINIIKRDLEDKIIETKELEDEFIAIIETESEVLCQLRKNKFPLKERPIDVDYFIPDSTGRRVGIGLYEFQDSLQKAYDSLMNQYIYGTVQSNNPIIFFEPTGNMRDEPMKIRNGYAYPTSNANSIKIFQLPQPNESIQKALDLIRFWSQLLFGISDFSAGQESQIDPGGPAKKAEIIVQQGNVRLNILIKRKNNTLKKIFRKWFLLYKENMPPHKLMRIAGEDKDNPWEFQNVSLTDFALKSIPDFEIVGNILNSNKALEANKAIAVYQLMTQNPFFAPQTAQGLQSLQALTKWLLDKLDETGISKFLPPAQGDVVHTPEEENARFLQGDGGEPEMEEDHVQHMTVHKDLLIDPTLPDNIRKTLAEHVTKHVELLKQKITQQMVLGNTKIPGGQNAVQGTPGAAPGVVQQQAPGVGPSQGGVRPQAGQPFA